SVNPFATKSAVLKTDESIEGVLFKGVEKDYRVSHLGQFMQEGRWPLFPDSSYSREIVLSAPIAKALKLKVGDKVFIYFIQGNGKSPRANRLTVSGIYNTGIEEYKNIALGDIRLIQRLNEWSETEIGGYEIFLHHYKRMDKTSEEVFKQLPAGWNSKTIREIYPNIFDWLDLQDNTIVLVLSIMTVVAVLNLIVCLIILVLERTRMIGVLKALGMPNQQLQAVFLYHGSIITISGILFGNLLALLLCWLQQRYGFIKLPEEMYYISKAEVRLEWWHFLLVDGGTFLICFLILFIPTLIVWRVQPVKAIQFR
ncbi:MAG: ABC transporter permease, partial [Bacteroidetes bacterium]|nr:ABC transporter permease [Bacteroidota bacterium]